MILRGSQIGPIEMDTVVNYLDDQFRARRERAAIRRRQPCRMGQARKIVEGSCAICHGLDRSAAQRAPTEWQAIVTRMVFLGAPLSADQANAAAEYLSANFGSAPRTAAAK